jgi:CheY-like chemotaxis protein
MTGVTRPGLETDAKAAGALGVLAKPFTPAELLATLSETLCAAA